MDFFLVENRYTNLNHMRYQQGKFQHSLTHQSIKGYDCQVKTFNTCRTGHTLSVLHGTYAMLITWRDASSLSVKSSPNLRPRYGC